jgi:hypothetical protein
MPGKMALGSLFRIVWISAAVIMPSASVIAVEDRQR